MGVTYLNVIPVNPELIPISSSQVQARKFLKTIYPNEEINISTSKYIEFIDQGEFFESVSCNLCGKEMKIEEWGEFMDSAFEDNFKNLIFTTNCCNKQTNLNELIYIKPAGFTKFKITIIYPHKILTQEEKSELENILGTKLKTVIAKA